MICRIRNSCITLRGLGALLLYTRDSDQEDQLGLTAKVDELLFLLCVFLVISFCSKPQGLPLFLLFLSCNGHCLLLFLSKGRLTGEPELDHLWHSCTICHRIRPDQIPGSHTSQLSAKSLCKSLLF